MATYTQSQIENVWFALNLNRLKPNNDMQSGAGLHNPNGSINMYKWLQDALDLLGNGSCGTSIGAVTLNGDAPLFTSTTCGATMNFTAGSGITLTGDGPTKSITIAASGGGSGDNIYNTSGTLTSDRVVTLSDKNLTFRSNGVAGLGPTTTRIFQNANLAEISANPIISADGDNNSALSCQSISSTLTITKLLAHTYLADTSKQIFGSIGVSSSTSGVSASLTVSKYSIANGEIGMLLTGTANTSYPIARIVLPTYYQTGTNNDAKLYMVPSVVDSIDSTTQHTYPLTSHVFSFSLNVNAQVNVDDVSTNLLITSADGNARRAIDVTISTRGSVGISFGNEIRIVIYKVSDDSIFYDTGAFIPSNTKGVIYSNSIDLALGSHESYYAKVTQIEGSSSENKGLCISLSTI